MEFELLVIPGCPHSDIAGELFRAALNLEGIQNPLTVREISTDSEAEVHSFHGSPTYSINGIDLFPNNNEPAVTCRVYPTPAGLAGYPSLSTLRQAIRDSLTATPTESTAETS